MSSELVKGENILSSRIRQNRDFKVKLYDFRRPDKFSMEQVRTVSIIHETFARLTSASMSVQLRHKVKIHQSAVDQMTYEEFIRSIPNPTTMAIIQIPPLKGSAVLEIDPNISSAVIDLLAGGRGEPSEENRALTHIERTLLGGMVPNILENLKESWGPILEVTPSLGQIETSPQFAQIVPPPEMILLVSFEVTLGDVKGYMNLCIPYITIEPVIGKLSAQYWYSTVKKYKNGCMSVETAASLHMDSEIITETEQLSLMALGSLKKGSLVKLDGFSNGRAFLRMGSEIIAPVQIKKSRKGFSCAINKDRRFRDNALLEHLHGESQDTSEENLKGSIQSLSDQITKVSGDLTHRIEELVNNQDLLNDRVFLQKDSDQPLQNIEEEPFSFIGFSDIPNLYHMLTDDHYQIIALILSRMKSELSARLLELFPADLQPRLIKRIGKIDRVSPVIIHEIEKILRNSLIRMNDNPEIDVEGMEKVTEILGVSSRSVEKNVIENLETMDDDLAEEIKKRMFVFEDIVVLDGPSVAKMAEAADLNDLCLAMKIVSDQSVIKHIFDNISENLRKKLEKCLEETGRVKISDVDKAQMRIISVIKNLEEQGEMVVCRPDEMTP